MLLEVLQVVLSGWMYAWRQGSSQVEVVAPPGSPVCPLCRRVYRVHSWRMRMGIVRAFLPLELLLTTKAHGHRPRFMRCDHP